MTAYSTASDSFSSAEMLRQDTLMVLLALLNQSRFAFLKNANTDSSLWSLLTNTPLDQASAFADPDINPKDLGLTYDAVSDITLAKDIMQMYAYGALGLEDVSAESLDNSEGAAAWTSKILADLLRSHFLTEWDEYAAGRFRPSIERCLAVAETANARLLLEGGREGFYLSDQNVGYLTFRQLALLSGMTEPSLRTLASRGTGLRTTKEGVSSYIQIDDAKEWLKAKSRYTPIRRVSNSGAVTPINHRFSSVDELITTLDERANFLVNEIGREVINERLRAKPLGILLEEAPAGRLALNLSEQQLLDRSLMKHLGKVLELPEERLALRASETVLSEQLRKIKHELDDEVSKST